ncbi:hypothetical protein [Sphingomonas sp. LT1P40]|uniref:hypothetical protein n=1 Tax=Alteristakelama amylovorans TaxID=3096166 RepID=UPI002FC76667
MSQLPAAVSTPGPLAHPSPPRGMLARIGGAASRLFHTGASGAARGLEAAGVAAERVRLRLFIVILALAGLIVLGALFRSIGWGGANYALIALAGAGALWAALSPLHLAGLLLVGGGVAAVRGAADAQAAMLGYARLLGRLLLGFLAILFLFALAPGDTSFLASMRLVLFGSVAVLAIMLFGRVEPRIERGLFVGLPLAALAVALANMLVPESVLARLGIPAWLRAPRPQDEELARIERAIETRRNAARAATLRTIREKVERGEPLTPADQAAIAQAQRDRVTLTGWADARYQAVLAEVQRRMAAPADAAKPLQTVALTGSLIAPSPGWSAPLPVPAGMRVCTASPTGERAYTTQCHLTGDAADRWQLRRSGRCVAGAVDRVRFEGRGRAQTVRYRLSDAAKSCPTV